MDLPTYQVFGSKDFQSLGCVHYVSDSLSLQETSVHHGLEPTMKQPSHASCTILGQNTAGHLFAFLGELNSLRVWGGYEQLLVSIDPANVA